MVNLPFLEKDSEETTAHTVLNEKSLVYSSQTAGLYSLLQRDAAVKITTHAIHTLNVVTD